MRGTPNGVTLWPWRPDEFDGADPMTPQTDNPPGPQCVLLMGLQCSGKTLFYRQRFAETHVRLSIDMLRTRSREKRFLDTCLAALQNFVVDNTNPTAVERARYLGPAKTAGFRTVGYYFATGIPECLRLNASRPPSCRVPDAAIYGTARRMQPPVPAEGFDELYVVRRQPLGDFVVREWTEGEGRERPQGEARAAEEILEEHEGVPLDQAAPPPARGEEPPAGDAA